MKVFRVNGGGSRLDMVDDLPQFDTQPEFEEYVADHAEYFEGGEYVLIPDRPVVSVHPERAWRIKVKRTTGVVDEK